MPRPAIAIAALFLLSGCQPVGGTVPPPPFACVAADGIERPLPAGSLPEPATEAAALSLLGLDVGQGGVPCWVTRVRLTDSVAFISA